MTSEPLPPLGLRSRSSAERGASPLGILILDSRFPRIPGDVGFPGSFPFPVLYEKLTGLTPAIAVREARPSVQTLDICLRSAERLIARGAVAITTSCGFLIRYQNALAERLPVPVATSSLLHVPLVERIVGCGRTVGVITAERASLTDADLKAAGIDPARTPVVGLPTDGAFARAVMADARTLDRDAIEAEVIAAANALTGAHPALGAVVLECTNLPPYADAVRAATGLPVFHILDLAAWLYAGARPRMA